MDFAVLQHCLVLDLKGLVNLLTPRVLSKSSAPRYRGSGGAFSFTRTVLPNGFLFNF